MTKRHCLWGVLLLLVAGAGVYWPGLGGGFIFDDYPNLVADPDWKVVSLSLDEWRRAMSLGIASDSGRPLALLSFAANHYFSGMDPLPMKLVGLGFHLLNGLLVFWLCRRLFALAATHMGAHAPGGYAAFLVAMAWLLHPLQVSTVLYIVQRMELGAAMGVLLALVCYVEARRAQCDGRRGWVWFLATLPAIALGLGFKESALLAPGFAFLIELFLLRFRGAHGGRSRPLQAAYVVVGVFALLVYVGVVLPRYLGDAAYAYRDFSLVERLYSQCHVLAMYLKQILWPMPETLLFYYDHLPVSTSLWNPHATLLGSAVLLVMLLAAWSMRRRAPLVSFGLCWFLMGHALTSNVVPLELAFEHRNYLALLGVLLAAAQGLAWLGRNLSRDTQMVLAVLPVALLVALCVIQVQRWSDPFNLAMALASGNPQSSRAGYELGKLMLERAGAQPDSPLVSLAFKEFEHASRLPRSSALPEQAMIVMLSRSGRVVDESIWESFRAKLSARPAGPQEYNALYGVASCRIRRQCALDDRRLFETYLAFMQRNIGSAKAHAMYANYAYNVLGDADLAIGMSREAIRLAPSSLQYRANLLDFLVATGRAPEEQTLIRSGILAEDPGYFRENGHSAPP